MRGPQGAPRVVCLWKNREVNIKGVNDYPASSAAGELGYLTVSEGAPGAR